eukprot:715093-Rhodomonas_salina.4
MPYCSTVHRRVSALLCVELIALAAICTEKGDVFAARCPVPRQAMLLSYLPMRLLCDIRY